MGICFSLERRKDPSSTKDSSTRDSSTGKNQFVFRSTTTSNTTNTTTENTTWTFTSDRETSVDESVSMSVSEGSRKANLRVFTFAELKVATRNFKTDSILGEGGFGTVYKGWLEENTLNPAKSGHGVQVAVKKLDSQSVQGLQEWKSEIIHLGSLHHSNLVKLLGYCSDERELLLVYEFVSRGSLENHLFRRGPNRDLLSWDLRMKIALGAARGLAFLHSSEKQQVIYRDFKSSNILLESDYSAKLSDFGLAKCAPTDDRSHVTTRVVGTYGYAAPEYVATGRLYVKSDVYGFGVVLLELLTGQRAMDSNRPAELRNLVEWAKPVLTNRRKVSGMMDKRLEGRYPSGAAREVARLTLKCLANDQKKRPSMEEVMVELERIEGMVKKPKELIKLVPLPKPTPPGRPRRRPTGTAAVEP